MKTVLLITIETDEHDENHQIIQNMDGSELPEPNESSENVTVENHKELHEFIAKSLKDFVDDEDQLQEAVLNYFEELPEDVDDLESLYGLKITVTEKTLAKKSPKPKKVR